ncbi:MAG: hypothetical protein H6510_14615 [Acidobacteria bacterium]|nr:hypothetical protein [Acidobacteriota bacterium]MCB9399044.1 hypothetical protein [Acidobacteriota bacterium]
MTDQNWVTLEQKWFGMLVIGFSYAAFRAPRNHGGFNPGLRTCATLRALDRAIHVAALQAAFGVTRFPNLVHFPALSSWLRVFV